MDQVISGVLRGHIRSLRVFRADRFVPANQVAPKNFLRDLSRRLSVLPARRPIGSSGVRFSHEKQRKTDPVLSNAESALEDHAKEWAWGLLISLGDRQVR